MHLLGTSVVAFILLPLALSCESTRRKEDISRAYKYVIGKQLDHINTSIEKHLNKTCTKRRNMSYPIENEIHYIYNVSCSHKLKGLGEELETQLKNFVAEINSSLGCNCPNKQVEETGKTRPPRLHRKLCKLKYFLARIQQAYEQYNSAP